MIIPLLGRFKTEDRERNLFTTIVFRTDSGPSIGAWVLQLAELKCSQGQTHCLAFSNHSGKLVNSQWLEMEILNYLHIIQGSQPDSISPDVNVHEEYGISRSFIGVLQMKLEINHGLASNYIDAMNWQSNLENAKGKAPPKIKDARSLL